MMVRPLISLAFFATFVVPSASAWDCAFPYRVELSVTVNTAHSEEVRIALEPSDFDPSYAFTPTGKDIRVFEGDDTTPVDHVVTDWDPVARTAIVDVRLSSLTVGEAEDIIIYYGDQDAVSGDNAAGVFPDPGTRIWSRQSAADPTNFTTARAAFDAATVDIYNDVRTNIIGLNNEALGGTRRNFGWCISTVLEVSPANAGDWDFRYGADFGRGGDFYAGESLIEEDWNNDLWWALNFANTAGTLDGSTNLQEGWHRLEIMGFEGCCDGPLGWQARPPGGSWQNLNTNNFNMRGAQCRPADITVTRTPIETCSSQLNASKSMNIVSDVLGNDSPYALPGSIIEYELAVDNPGRNVDDGTVALTDALPSNVRLIVDGPNAFELVDGAPSSNLTLDWAGPASTLDSVDFSTDGNFTGYTPTPDGENADAAVTHVRFRLTGELAAYSDVAGTPSFGIRFRAIVE